MKINLDNYSVTTKAPEVKGKFINRELSFLSFNQRVLYYAHAPETPLNERLNFLAITGSNLDEFISVRYAYAEKNKETEPAKDILNEIITFKKTQNAVFNELKELLQEKGKRITKLSKLDKKYQRKAHSIFQNLIFPVLTPIHIGSINDYPNLYSGQTCIACIIGTEKTESVNIIPINKSLDPVYEIDGNIITIDDIILSNLDSLFINKEIKSKGVFRVIKDASVELNHDTSRFLIDRMEETLIERSLAKPIFMDISKDTPNDLKAFLSSIFNISNKNIFSDSHFIDYKRLNKISLVDDESCSFKPFTPYVFTNQDNHFSLFQTLNDQDLLLHHPYDSFETVIRFLNHAADDPYVVAIKQTLYRVSPQDSPIVAALCRAAQNGKSVSVLIEIKARFDEENNIRLINKLKSSGVNVLLGLEYLKTHCKMCLVIRKEGDSLKVYSDVATGNFNEKTAELYTDLSFLTSRQKIGTDLLHVFNIISGFSTPDDKLQKIDYSPVTLRKKFIKLIEREIDNAKKKRPAEILLKLNSISDPLIINKLYEAAEKGVHITIICRGITSIVARENIEIKSIVGRFLEHSRVYYFQNDKNPEYYISSADLLTRNLDRRVEIMVNLKDSTVENKLRYILKALKMDDKNSFSMDHTGTYRKNKGTFDCHQWLIDNADGRGKLKKEKINNNK